MIDFVEALARQMRLLDPKLTLDDVEAWAEEIVAVLDTPDVEQLRAAFRKVRGERTARRSSGAFVGAPNVDEVITAYRLVAPDPYADDCDGCTGGLISVRTGGVSFTTHACGRCAAGRARHEIQRHGYALKVVSS